MTEYFSPTQTPAVISYSDIMAGLQDGFMMKMLIIGAVFTAYVLFNMFISKETKEGKLKDVAGYFDVVALVGGLTALVFGISYKLGWQI